MRSGDTFTKNVSGDITPFACVVLGPGQHTYFTENLPLIVQINFEVSRSSLLK